jgi:hypothetical protein
MSYELRRNRSKLPEKGNGYPTVDDEGNVTLPDKDETIPPAKYLWVRVISDTPETPPRPSARGALLVDAPGGQPQNPARPSTRRR